MRIFLFFTFYFIFSISNAQNSFFVDDKGKKTIMRDDSIEIIVIDKRIAFAENGKSWEKYIAFDKLDYAIIGDYYFKSFELITDKGKKKKKSAYFVITETEEKKLLSYHYTKIGKYSSVDYFFIYIIDNNNNILDYVEINETPIYIKARGKISGFINKHFSDCPDLISKYKGYDQFDDANLSILNFFRQPSYFKCN